ncbi:hypothetical protein C2845_PM01G25650 [Panicum miliaceum]|uniref:Electron transfer flavoprotein subunit alpha, mitochondrial n=1 Tax=Panicum miliaceum TaxID=4540 RepID=A0A3L6TWR2_PANMI|nr:hypothetical protein C2845_PM01G25650 [Panicum miliaceum]
MAAMVVGALRRGSGYGGGGFHCSSRLLVQSLRRFASTLVVAEHEGGFVKPSSLSALAAAEAIAKENKIYVLLGGSGPALHKAADHAASSHPLVSEVLVADSESLAHPLAEPWAELLHSVQQKGGYSHVIASSTSFGKNLLPRAAALLDVSPVTDVTAIKEPRVFVRPIYAGNALCTVKYTGEDPCMMSIRSTSFSPTTEAMSEVAPITQVDLSFLSEGTIGKSTWVNLTSQDTERPDLANARVVVTGGRGLKSAENFKLLEQLAEKLGAAVGATRAAVDAGYVPNDLQRSLTVDARRLRCLRYDGGDFIGLPDTRYTIILRNTMNGAATGGLARTLTVDTGAETVGFGDGEENRWLEQEAGRGAAAVGFSDGEEDPEDRALDTNGDANEDVVPSATVRRTPRTARALDANGNEDVAVLLVLDGSGRRRMFHRVARPGGSQRRPAPPHAGALPFRAASCSDGVGQWLSVPGHSSGRVRKAGSRWRGQRRARRAPRVREAGSRWRFHEAGIKGKCDCVLQYLFVIKGNSDC